MTAAERIASRELAPVRFTADEFMELVQHPPVSEWVGKIELIDGEIVHMSPANNPHWFMARTVFLGLNAALEPLGREWLVGPEPTVRFGKRSVRLPDIGVFRDPKLSESIFLVADLFLAVEIADTTLRHDLGRKQVAYAEAAVPHYWVVDVNGRKIHIMTGPEAGGYATKSVIPFGEPVPVPGTDAAITID
jgi:Uma2 family endonuclease